MRTPPPTMDYQLRLARRQLKQARLLTFLASGETYTSTELAARIMSVSRPNAFRTLQSMEREHLVKSEKHHGPSKHYLTLWGITDHGAGMAGIDDAPIFQLGRTNPAYIPHRLDGQRMRLAAEAAGWRDWTPERMMSGRGLTKVPDAAATSPAGERVAIEIERNAKTAKRYAEIVLAYIQTFKAGTFHHVDFVCPAPQIKEAVARRVGLVRSVKYAGESVQLTDAHRARFRFYDFTTWPPERAERAEVANG